MIWHWPWHVENRGQWNNSSNPLFHTPQTVSKFLSLCPFTNTDFTMKLVNKLITWTDAPQITTRIGLGGWVFPKGRRRHRTEPGSWPRWVGNLAAVLFRSFSFQCSKSCDGGSQRRRAICVNTRNDVLDDRKCAHQEKVTIQRCNEFSCPQWKSADWSEVR